MTRNVSVLLDLCLIECVKKLKNSLFIVGEIGGNDYNYPLTQGQGIEKANTIVPNVIQAIKDAVRVSFLFYGLKCTFDFC